MLPVIPAPPVPRHALGKMLGDGADTPQAPGVLADRRGSRAVPGAWRARS